MNPQNLESSITSPSLTGTSTISKVFDLALKIFLVVGVIFYVPYNPAETIPPDTFSFLMQELFFRYGVITLFFISMFKRPLRFMDEKHLAWLGLFVLLLAVYFGFGTVFRHKLLNVFTGLLFFKIVYENFDFSTFKSYGYWFGGVILLNLAFCVLQYNGVDRMIQPIGLKGGFEDSLVGLMKHKVHLGAMSAILAPVIVFFAPMFSLALVPLLWFGRSSSAIGAITVSFLIWGWYRLDRKLFVMLCIGLLAGLFSFTVFYDMPGGQFGERLKVWNESFALAMRTNPIIGNGVGSFAMQQFQTPQTPGMENLTWIWAHNEFVQGFFELGAVGMGIILAFLYQKLSGFSKASSDSMLLMLLMTVVSILCVSFFHFPFHVGRFVHLCIFFIALYSARLRYAE